MAIAIQVVGCIVVWIADKCVPTDSHQHDIQNVYVAVTIEVAEDAHSDVSVLSIT